jgi:hypothetical protein
MATRQRFQFELRDAGSYQGTPSGVPVKWTSQLRLYPLVTSKGCGVCNKQRLKATKYVGPDPNQRKAIQD